MTCIYALREIGNAEVRYVGITRKPLAERLTKHTLNAARGYPRLVSAWINEGRAIEIVPLCECEPEAAFIKEREMVGVFHALGHRLTNSHLVPRAA